MNTRTATIYISILLGAAIFGCGNSVSPEKVDSSFGIYEHNTLTLQEQSDGWILLFDGESLDGWEDPNKENPPGNSWVVEDGCIKANPFPRLREDLFTVETFGNFELTIEWKISEKGNSGIKYRIQDRAILAKGKTDPNARRFEDTVDYELENRICDRSQLGPQDTIEEYVIAYEYQIIDNQGHPDAANDTNRQSGAIYGLISPSTQNARPVGEFNRSRILLRGNRIEHWLNGEKIVDTDLKSEVIRQGLEDRWGTSSPVYRLLTEMPKTITPVVLQHHNNEVWFRNVKIRRLQ